MNSVPSRLATSFNTPSPLLRRALLTDATLTAIVGIALVLAAGPLGAFLELPATALRIAGVIFIPLGAFEGWLGTRPRVHRSLVFVVIVIPMLTIWTIPEITAVFEQPLMALVRALPPQPIGQWLHPSS